MTETEEYYRNPYNDTFCVMKFHADQHYDTPIPLRRAVDYSKASEVDAQLFSAADVGDVELLQQMLEQGADVNFQHCAGTPLTRAARRGHLECVQVLLDHGADINMSGNFNCQTCTALHAAASNGRYEVAKLLIDRGADVNAERDQGSTPLHDAAKFGHPDIAELLLRHGAKVNERNKHGKTPIFLAASEGKLDGLRWVLEAVIEYYHYRGFHYNEAFYPEGAVEYLLSNQEQVNALSMADLQNVRTSLLKDDLDTIKLIVKDQPASNDIKQRQLQLLKVLIDAGANTEILDNYDNGPLEEAIVKNDEECISFLINHGAIINRAGSVYGYKGTPLHLACSRETENIVKLFLENGADPNALDETGQTPLHVAVYEGNAEIVHSLLRHGAQVDVIDNDGASPLHLVKTLECARLLVEHGADATALRKDGRTVLFAPSEREGEGACVEFLIQQGADPLKEDENGITALDLAMKRWYYYSSYEKDDGGLGCSKVLINHGAKIKPVDISLNKAIMARRLGLAVALLRSGIDVNAVGYDGTTPLFCAAKTNFAAAVEMLLEEGADPHIKCRNKSPLDVALQNGCEDAAEVLVKAGAVPNSNIYNLPRQLRTYTNVLKKLAELEWQDSEGCSPLHTQCYKLASIFELLECKTGTNVADRQGITPLHIVSFKGHKPHVRLLLENKADPNKKDNNGLTALHFAAFEGHVTVGAVLLENGADVNAKDENGRTPAHIAAQCGCDSYLELLLTRGADVNVRDNLGWIPLHLAERNECAECVELLVKHGADKSIPTPEYYIDSKIPSKLFKNISKFMSYTPDSPDDSDIDLGFGLFD